MIAFEWRISYLFSLFSFHFKLIYIFSSKPFVKSHLCVLLARPATWYLFYEIIIMISDSLGLLFLYSIKLHVIHYMKYHETKIINITNSPWFVILFTLQKSKWLWNLVWLIYNENNIHRVIRLKYLKAVNKSIYSNCHGLTIWNTVLNSKCNEQIKLYRE